MPGFGKSGTCRMRCFRVSISPYFKSAHAARALVADRDVLDERGRRTASNLAFKPIDRLPVAFDQCLDAAVGQILHPAAQILRRRGFTRKEPEAHALHTAADHETTGCEHRSISRDATD